VRSEFKSSDVAELEAKAEGPLGDGDWIVTVRAFSGLVSSPWALASMAALAPNDHEKMPMPLTIK
jgi:hypothetical protein